jgi:hypothetical protein
LVITEKCNTGRRKRINKQEERKENKEELQGAVAHFAAR